MQVDAVRHTHWRRQVKKNSIKRQRSGQYNCTNITAQLPFGSDCLNTAMVCCLEGRKEGARAFKEHEVVLRLLMRTYLGQSRSWCCLSSGVLDWLHIVQHTADAQQVDKQEVIGYK